jgi:hypothetical protein
MGVKLIRATGCRRCVSLVDCSGLLINCRSTRTPVNRSRPQVVLLSFGLRLISSIDPVIDRLVSSSYTPWGAVDLSLLSIILACSSIIDGFIYQSIYLCWWHMDLSEAWFSTTSDWHDPRYFIVASVYCLSSFVITLLHHRIRKNPESRFISLSECCLCWYFWFSRGSYIIFHLYLSRP